MHECVQIGMYINHDLQNGTILVLHLPTTVVQVLMPYASLTIILENGKFICVLLIVRKRAFKACLDNKSNVHCLHPHGMHIESITLNPLR